VAQLVRRAAAAATSGDLADLWNAVSMAVMVLRCSDGHLFTATALKLMFLSVHVIDKVWLRCPVDHKWRMASMIPVGALSDTDLYEAQQHRF
jgi:hypothetical protein